MRAQTWTVPLTMAAALLAACVTVSAEAAPDKPATPAAGLVMQDQTALRAAPREAAPQQTLLWRGEALEIRGERGEYLQVWDHQRERGGYVRRAAVYRVDGASAQDLMAVLGFVAEVPGAEAMGLGLAAAAVQAGTPQQLAGPQGAALLDAIGRLAERLADRASTGVPPRDQAALTAHLDVAARLGVRLISHDRDGRVQLCYDGDAFQRVLAMNHASAEHKARAALALTRDDCIPRDAKPREREALDEQRAERLERVATESLGTLMKNRVAIRRASVWSSLAYARARRGDDAAAKAAADRALAEIAAVDKTDLADDDLARWNEAALRVNAVRWAAMPRVAASNPRYQIGTSTTEDGQTCVTLVDTRHADPRPQLQRCTWGLVWTASATLNREGNALALAVQPADGWRELWVFRKEAGGWALQVLPPAPLAPGLGYAEFAGWVPGGRQMLMAREAIAEGRNQRRFEVLKLDSFTPERQAFDPSVLGAFNRWQDVGWKRWSLAMR